MSTGQLTPILVVENNADDSFLLTRRLAKAHFEDFITVIGNGHDALDFLSQRTTAPIAIFLDLLLPDLSGIRLLERIRQEPRLQAVPVIVMTVFIAPIDFKECSRLGVTTYLSKPIGLITFIKTVAHLFPQVTVPR